MVESKFAVFRMSKQTVSKNGGNWWRGNYERVHAKRILPEYVKQTERL